MRIISESLVPGGKANLRVAKAYSEARGLLYFYAKDDLHYGDTILEVKASTLEDIFGYSRYNVDTEFEMECMEILALREQKRREEDPSTFQIDVF